MSSSFEDEDENPGHVFPLSDFELEQVSVLVTMIRRRLPDLGARDIQSASAVLNGLERLPYPTGGVHIVFGFRTEINNGNYGWADIEINDSDFCLGVGEHFYSPTVGGDTESRKVFEAICGATECDGEISEWIEEADYLFQNGIPSIEDNSEYDEINWEPEPNND